MKTIAAGLTTVLAVLALALTSPAVADTTECLARIGVVQADLDAVYAAGGLTGGNAARTYQSLTSKLQGAAMKIGEDKPGDAAAKLEDFISSVAAMRDATKPKISGADASLLLSGGGRDTTEYPDEGAYGAWACLP